jgi:hypothetical protein
MFFDDLRNLKQLFRDELYKVVQRVMELENDLAETRQSFIARLKLDQEHQAKINETVATMQKQLKQERDLNLKILAEE